MRSLIALPLLSLLASTVAADVNTSREFFLKTELRGLQPLKGRFADLYLGTWHTGAGLSDATLVNAQGPTVKAFLDNTNLLFNFGDTVPPFGLVPVLNADPESSWQPTQINGGAHVADFHLDETLGLVWGNEQFGGWFVCDWWHYANPQLFFKLAGFQGTLINPLSCADVYLIPEYI